MYLVWCCGLQTPIQWPISKYFGEPCWHGNRQRRVSFGTIYTHVWFTQLQYNSPSGKETNNHTYYIFSHPVFVWIAWRNSKHESAGVVELWFSVIDKWEWGGQLVELIFYYFINMTLTICRAAMYVEICCQLSLLGDPHLKSSLTVH